MNTISFPKMFNHNNYRTNTNLSYDYKSINESLKSLLLTSPGELLGDPAYGCAIKEKLFDIKSDVNIHELKNVIAYSITKYLPEITIVKSNIAIYSNPNNNRYKIIIPYTFINNTNDYSFEIII